MENTAFPNNTKAILMLLKHYSVNFKQLLTNAASTLRVIDMQELKSVRHSSIYFPFKHTCVSFTHQLINPPPTIINLTY